MIIFNITVNISHAAEKDWLVWMKQVHIPEILATELPLEHKLLRLLTEIDNEGATYTSQFIFRTMEDFVTYQANFQPGFQQKLHDRFNGQYVSFRTLLEEL
jgi:hypothetical protein